MARIRTPTWKVVTTNVETSYLENEANPEDKTYSMKEVGEADSLNTLKSLDCKRSESEDKIRHLVSKADNPEEEIITSVTDRDSIRKFKAKR